MTGFEGGGESTSLQSRAILFDQTLPIPFPRSFLAANHALTPTGRTRMIHDEEEGEGLVPYKDKTRSFVQAIPSMSVFHLTKESGREYRQVYTNLSERRSHIYPWLEAHAILGTL